MKNVFLLFLMLVLPLQGLWAAGQTYNLLEEGHETPSVIVFHDHGHGHEHNSSDSSAESDHHHHCTGHCAGVLPSLVNNPQPDLRYDEYSPEPMPLTTHLNTRIERPNWC